MSKPADTWMPLYIGDYLADTLHLTRGQHGAYLLIIMAYWRNGGPLPDDDDAFAAITRAHPGEWKKQLRPVMARFFRIDSDGWHHKRIDAELGVSQHLTKVRSESGTRGAAKRWQTHGKHNGLATDLPLANASQNDAPSPSQSSSLRSEDYSEPLRASGSARAPPLPHDPVKSLWDKGLSILGPRQRSLLGKLRKSHGDPTVLAAIVQCEEENPSDPPAFLIACCQRRHDNDQKLSPVENLYLGAARAADAFDRRQREAARCPDCDAVEPLLDRRRSAC